MVWENWPVPSSMGIQCMICRGATVCTKYTVMYPSKTFSGFRKCGKEPGVEPWIDIKRSGLTLRAWGELNLHHNHRLYFNDCINNIELDVIMVYKYYFQNHKGFYYNSMSYVWNKMSFIERIEIMSVINWLMFSNTDGNYPWIKVFLSLMYEPSWMKPHLPG